MEQFDLNNQDDASAALDYVFRRLGKPLTVRAPLHQGRTHTVELTPRTVTAWRNPESFALQVDDSASGLPFTFHGVTQIGETTPAPEEQ
ncbi:hypothetical protein [Streptosporangium sp. NPDC001681]|uniref:hypothetical protein n=1 Tax=Streptosporangium sp. NPDC001681 TaxID=3154395 RepID=UPI00332BB156